MGKKKKSKGGSFLMQGSILADFYEACWSWMGQPESMRNLQKA